jgi:endonuclease YncB( thermonuclease family)
MITRGSYVSILLVGLALLAGVPVLLWVTHDPDVIHVLDGDTVVYRGQVVRLVGFDAPEIGERAMCKQERALGEKAKARLMEIVAGGRVMANFFDQFDQGKTPASPVSALNLDIVRCACRPGTEDTPACNYGRKCGVLELNGKNVGEILIREKLAVPMHCTPCSCKRDRSLWQCPQLLPV